MHSRVTLYVHLETWLLCIGMSDIGVEGVEMESNSGVSSITQDEHILEREIPYSLSIRTRRF